MAKKVKKQDPPAINLRFGSGTSGSDWIKVIDRACELAGGKDGAIAKNYWIRELMLNTPEFKKAMRQLGIKLSHPPKRGTYDRASRGLIGKPRSEKPSVKK